MSVLRHIHVLLLLLGAAGLFAQDNWALRVGAWSNEAYNDVAVDAQGDLYAVGEFGGNIELDATTTIISQGSLDAVVVRYAADGTLVWARTFGGPGLDRAIKLALTPDGGIAVVGQFMGVAFFGSGQLISQGGTQDVFVMKLAQSDGSVQWVRQGGSPDGVDQPNGVNVGPDGSIAVAGEFRGTSVFDAGTLTSVIDPDNGLPSVDIFLATYASDGTPQWIQQGAAEFADRGMDVVYDPAGNLYLTGQFSDTITFDQTHTNAMYSAIFIARFSPTGQEDWFRVFGGGTYNQVFEMVLVEQDRLMLVGDLQGTVIFLDSSPDLFTATAPRSSFLLEVDFNGELLRKTTWGSENIVNTRALSVQGDDIAVLGRFACQFTDFSAVYGEGTFLATGPNDLYVARFQLSDLLLKEAQQFGGQGDKVPGGIVHTPDAAHVFSGSFEHLLVFPSTHVFDASPGGSLDIPAVAVPYCADPNYSGYTGLRGSALKDGFLARGYDDAREPYDIFSRPGGPCDRSPRDAVIRSGADGVVGPDSIQRCAVASLYAFTNTAYTPDTSHRHTAPDMLFLWSTGAVTQSISTFVSGWYWVHVTSAAGCWERTDSIHVTVDPVPPFPRANDDVVVNVNAHPPAPIVVCEPQQPWLWATGLVPQNTIAWELPNGTFVPNDSVQALVTGIYRAVATTPAGCYQHTFVDVTIVPSGPLPPIDAALDILFPDDTDLNDTVGICRGSVLLADVQVLLTLNGVPTDIPYAVSALGNCGTVWGPAGGSGFQCIQVVDEEGWYVTHAGYMLTNRPCGEDTLVWWHSDSVYVLPLEVLQPDVSVAGPALMCPGDTVALVGSCTGCTEFAWQGDGITEATADTAWIIEPGIFFFTATVVDTNGCSNSATEEIHVAWNPQPLLAVDPLDGIICPNATATIWSESEGLSYQWYGPLGPMSVPNDTIITSQQGFYYLEMIDSLGCFVTSDPILVTDYATPFLNVLPDNVLCGPDETATLQVVTTSTATLLWAAPFDGSTALQQVVTQPGIYTCSVNACGITTVLSVEIFGNTANAELVVPGPFTICPGTELTLEAQPGEAVYYWYPGPIFGTTITTDTSGTYLLVVTDAVGCQDSLWTEVVVLPSYVELALLDTSFCVGEPIVVTTQGDGTITWYADAAMTQVLGTGNDLALGSLQQSTTVWVQQGVGPCSSELMEVHVGVYQSPVSPTVVGDTSVCEGSALILTTLPQLQNGAVWYGPEGVFAMDTLVLSPVGLGDQGAWFVIVGNPGCVAPPTPFTVTVVDAAELDLGGDTSLCSQGSILFQVPGGFSQPSWNDGTSGTSYTAVEEGTVWLSAIDVNGCAVHDTVFVSYYDFAQPLSATGSTICLGASTTLLANGSGVLHWYADTLLTLLVHTGDQWYLEEPADSATYYVTQTEAGCTSTSVPVVLAVVPIPTDVQLVQPSPACVGSDLQLTLVGEGEPTGSWATPSGVFQGTSITVDGLGQSDAGTYTVVPFFGTCAGDTLSIEVDVLVPVPPYLGPDTVICEGGALVLSVPTGYTSPSWGDNSVSVVAPGWVYLAANDPQGCPAADSLWVDVQPCDPVIPNVVTPNGDGTNDLWILGPGGYIKAWLEVYNRWGQRVWEGDVVHVGFRGDHGDTGEPLSEATYYYLLTLTRGNGTQQVLQGHFTLLR